jgi:dephospho-CoA kinase
VTARVIGLTGGIASGKSTVGRLLAARGAAIVDADLLAREVVEPGQPALAELVARFGAAILTPEGHLDRKRLGAIAYADPAARADLGRITHPRIAAASAQAIAAWSDRGAAVVFYEAALLVENRAHLGLDGLVVVAAPPEVQLARILARDGLSPEEAHARIAAQLPLAAKVAAATWVIDNTGDATDLAARTARVIAEIEAAHGPIAVPTAPGDGAAATGPRPPDEVALVTGFPAFTARRMIAKLAAAEPTTAIRVLVQARFLAEAEAFVEGLATRHGAGRITLLTGDVCAMDLGLSSTEYQALAAEVTWIHHLAGIYFMGVEDALAHEVNVVGTRTVLELAAEAPRLRRLVHWSTALVSGDRKGLVTEDDLEAGQRFHNGYERTKYESEVLARRAMRRLPVTVLRPGIIVGDSTTGEIGKLDGPYYLMVLIATNASKLRLPLLGRGDGPLHLVPIDYVVEAAWQVARRADAAGRTFHLTDPAPLLAREVFALVAAHAHTEPPRGFIPRGLARAVLRAPGLARRGRGPLAMLDLLEHRVRYDRHHTEAALAGTGVTCPPLRAYLPTLVSYMLAHAPRPPGRSGGGGGDEASDPLA